MLRSNPTRLAAPAACLRFILFLALAVIIAPGTAKAARALGIDVSSYQGGSINWTSVKGSGIVFAWAKATEGGGVNDADFTVNMNNGKAAGVYMAAYHYAHPELNSPATEASHFWSIAGSKITADGLSLVPMLDIEGSAFSGHVGASSLSDWINSWCADIVQDAANAGVTIQPAIYVSACNACNFDGTVGQWNNDIADYNNDDPQTSTPWTTCTGCERWGSGGWDFWQYTSTGAIPGISGNVDHDVYNGTGAQLVANMLAIASTNSTIFYWDPQGTTGGNPYTGSMTGTWENSKWSYGSAGLGSPVAWVNGKAACFGVHTGAGTPGTPAFTVTMNSGHVVAGFFDGALTPNSCDVTIQGAGTIDLASGPQALDSQNNSSDGSLGLLRINCNIAGSGKLYPEGNGQSFLHGTNTYTGGTALGYPGVPFSGTVNFNNGDAFGTGTITFWTNGTGGALVLEGAAAVTVPNDVAVTSRTTNNIVGNAAGLTFSGDWSTGGNLFTLGTGNTAGKQVIISGSVSGTAGLATYNAGTLVLSGTNTYTGTTTIYGPAVFTVGDPGSLGSGAYAGNIVNNGTFNYNSTASQTLSGTISGVGALKQSNGGLLVLTHANTFTGGTTVSSGGTLSVTSDSALGAATNSLTLSGGCLKNNVSAPTVTAARTLILIGAGVPASAQGGYLDAGWAPSHPLTISAKITGSGRLHINQDGSPVVLANVTNDYSGGTYIGTNGPGYYALGTNAWLKLGASGVIPNGSGKGNVFISQAYNGMLDLAGFTQTINGLSGDGTVDNTTGNGALSVGNNNASSTFSGVIQDTAGNLSLTKIGSGTLTLAGANTYSGPTTVSAGKLALGAGGSIGPSAVGVGTSATLANSTTNTGVIGGPVLFGSGSLAGFTAVGGVPSAVGELSISGDLMLNSPTVTINVTGAALAAGAYRLLDCTGLLSGSANSTPTITGTALGAGYTASVVTTPGTAGHVDLIVKATPAFANLTASQSIIYGASGILLSGTVSGPGPVYPVTNETIAVTINGNMQTTTINDATGDFLLTYNPSTLPAAAGPYPIGYSYAGNALLNPVADASTTLTVSNRPVVLTGTRLYDGTTNAAAAILSVTNAVGSDIVTVASGTAILANANAGLEPITSFGTLTLGGASAANYTLTGASGSVTITVPSFSIISQHIDITGTNFVITWESMPGATYHIVANSNGAAALNLWTPAAGPVTATDTNTTVTIPMISPTSVFDVRSP